MTRVATWVRWEFSRRIEITPMLRLIIAERFIKGTALVLGGLALAILSGEHVFTEWAEDIQKQLLLTPTRNIIVTLIDNVILRFGGLSVRAEVIIGSAAAAYGALDLFEGVGLVLRRRWAEYLVLVATVAFLPLEVDELIKHATIVKAGAFLLNVVIAAYLIWRKRLFLERAGDLSGESGEAA